jgi:hypothetical protein
MSATCCVRKSNFEVFLLLKVYKLSELKKKYINSSVLETAIKDVLDVDIGERGTKKMSVIRAEM